MINQPKNKGENNLNKSSIKKTKKSFKQEDNFKNNYNKTKKTVSMQLNNDNNINSDK
jgi:hypothetical protein